MRIVCWYVFAPNVSWTQPAPSSSCETPQLSLLRKKNWKKSILQRAEPDLVPREDLSIWNPLRQVKWPWNWKFIMKSTYPEHFLSYEKNVGLSHFMDFALWNLPIFSNFSKIWSLAKPLQCFDKNCLKINFIWYCRPILYLCQNDATKKTVLVKIAKNGQFS